MCLAYRYRRKPVRCLRPKQVSTSILSPPSIYASLTLRTVKEKAKVTRNKVFTLKTPMNLLKESVMLSILRCPPVICLLFLALAVRKMYFVLLGLWLATLTSGIHSGRNVSYLLLKFNQRLKCGLSSARYSTAFNFHYIYYVDLASVRVLCCRFRPIYETSYDSCSAMRLCTTSAWYAPKTLFGRFFFCRDTYKRRRTSSIRMSKRRSEIHRALHLPYFKISSSLACVFAFKKPPVVIFVPFLL